MAERNTKFFCSKRLMPCDKEHTRGCKDCILNKHRDKDTRPSAARRGYGSKWKMIRLKVLEQCGIPRDSWPLYDVDHNPAYNPQVEPDHWKYQLIPRLHSEHSTKTMRSDVRRSPDGRLLPKSAPRVPRSGSGGSK